MDKHLHIVSFDVPFPADYGGVIDVFYKVIWLHKQGVKIHLHCFTKGRAAQPELEKYCEEVHYYERKTGLKGFSFSLPYIVSSRKSNALLNELKKDDYPVLFEGIHTTYWLYKNELKGRQIFIRMHNVEYKYYKSLAKNESGFFKRIYFLWESNQLKKYEKKNSDKASLLAISKDDANSYLWELNAHNIEMIPAFSAWNEVKSLEGSGNYCLYHGNLSVNENVRVAAFIIKEIAGLLSVPLIIAGKNPPFLLYAIAKKYPKVSIVANPSDEELFGLIQNAHINLMFSFNDTGVKLKLLNVLYNGRFCIANTRGAFGSGLDNLCEILLMDETGVYATDFGALVNPIMHSAFSNEDISLRKDLLGKLYNNEKNAAFLSSLLR